MTRKQYNLLIVLVVLLISCCVVFSSCNSNGSSSSGENAGGISSSSETTSFNTSGVASRKVIYTLVASIYTEKTAAEIADEITSSLEEDEWTDSKTIYSSQGGTGTIVLRIKSSRLEEFMASLSTYGTVGNYSVTSQDVTLDYSDVEDKIASLTATRASLVALLSSTTNIDEIISINEAIADTDLELTKYNNKKNNYDSLIDYSKVTIYINQNYYEADPTFAQDLGNTFESSWNAFLAFLVFLLKALIYIIPFAILGGIVAVVVVYITKKTKKNKKLKNNNNAIINNESNKTKDEPSNIEKD